MVPDPLPRRAEGRALTHAGRRTHEGDRTLTPGRKRSAVPWLLAGLLLPALLFATVPLGRGPGAPPTVLHGRAAGQRSSQGPLRAGAARVRIALPEHPVLAGYPGLRRAGEAGEPVYARALALSAGEATVLIASLDTLLIPAALEEEVLRRAGLPPATCLLLAATHTHSGPGGAWDSLLGGLAGSGPFSAVQRDALAQAAADALRGAQAGLAPAELQIAQEDWAAGPAQARSEGALDRALVAVRLRSAPGPGAAGAEIATLLVYGMHPTQTARQGKRLSPDWPGRVAAALEGPPALVLQGASGNATWSGDDPAAAVVAEARRLLAGGAVQRAPMLSCETRLVALPRAEASPRTPLLSRRAWTNLLALSLEPFAVQTRLSLGGLSLIGVPGEPVGEVGLLARPQVLVGLADGYAGYLETPAHWAAGAGESGKTYFGPGLAKALGLAPPSAPATPPTEPRP